MADAIILEVEEKMEKGIERVASELATINTGRANPQIFNKLMVQYYGAPTPMNQVAQVSTPDGQTLMITPYDKSALGDIETAVQLANLGFNPVNDGSVIRINIPPLTTERRQEFAKSLKAMGEDGKIVIRNIRRDGNDSLKKADLTEDELKSYQEDVQKLTDSFIVKIDKLVSEKEKDVLTI